MFDVLDISTTGLTAQRQRMTAISNNIANMETTRSGLDAAGRPVPYRRRTTLFAPKSPFRDQFEGVRARHIQDRRPFNEVYRPDHPDADPETGKLKMPNVNIIDEYVDAMTASRSYEANVQAMNITKAMIRASIGILA
ncbi:MAG: flagellar basal body rod protein FlgC [Planctomycetota bacterium]